jgi:Arc/MetJ family transcription regulator
MRTNIVISNELMNKAISLSENKTKKAVVEEALRLLVRFKEQLKIKELRGKLNWEGNLNQMRTDS